MDPAEIEENLKTIINDIENSKPPTRTERAITLVSLKIKFLFFLSFLELLVKMFD